MTITTKDFAAGHFYVTVAPEAFGHGAYDEDGAMLVGECFHVWVTDSRGFRRQHETSFSTRLESDEWGCGVVGFDEARASAERLAARVAARLSAGGALDEARWHEIDPEYGSYAYVRLGIEAERAMADRLAE